MSRIRRVLALLALAVPILAACAAPPAAYKGNLPEDMPPRTTAIITARPTRTPWPTATTSPSRTLMPTRTPTGTPLPTFTRFPSLLPTRTPDTIQAQQHVGSPV